MIPERIMLIIALLATTLFMVMTFFRPEVNLLIGL
jgi:hypothetical protein